MIRLLKQLDGVRGVVFLHARSLNASVYTDLIIWIDGSGFALLKTECLEFLQYRDNQE